MDSGAHRQTTSDRSRRAGVALVLALVAAAVWLVVGATAPQDVQGQLDAKQSELDRAESQRGVLSTEIERYSNEISQQARWQRFATARRWSRRSWNRRRRSSIASAHLNVLRDRLKASVELLEERLIAIYKSDTPDVLTVVLEADGFTDLLERCEYLNRIEEQDSDIVDRVRELRSETKVTVARIEPRATRSRRRSAS